MQSSYSGFSLRLNRFYELSSKTSVHADIEINMKGQWTGIEKIKIPIPSTASNGKDIVILQAKR